MAKRSELIRDEAFAIVREEFGFPDWFLPNLQFFRNAASMLYVRTTHVSALIRKASVAGAYDPEDHAKLQQTVIDVAVRLADLRVDGEFHSARAKAAGLREARHMVSFMMKAFPAGQILFDDAPYIQNVACRVLRVDEFCSSFGISRKRFNTLRAAGCSPSELSFGPRSIRIDKNGAADWARGPGRLAVRHG